MGLVQAETEESEQEREVLLDNIRIIWDANVERMTNRYGAIFVDHVNSVYGARLVVGFRNASC